MMERDLWFVEDEDGYQLGEGGTREQCERAIAYYIENFLEYGKKFHITDIDTDEILATYERCEHFECADNISCENCLAYPNCPLHKRLGIKSE